MILPRLGVPPPRREFFYFISSFNHFAGIGKMVIYHIGDTTDMFCVIHA